MGVPTQMGMAGIDLTTFSRTPFSPMIEPPADPEIVRIDRGGRVRLRITSRDDLESLLEKLSPDEIATYGLVLESDLREVTTLSIGQIVLDAITVTYHGMQRVVVDNNGRSAYGGSDLICVRGGWEALDQLWMSAEVRRGVTQAKIV